MDKAEVSLPDRIMSFHVQNFLRALSTNAVRVMFRGRLCETARSQAPQRERERPGSRSSSKQNSKAFEEITRIWKFHPDMLLMRAREGSVDKTAGPRIAPQSSESIFSHLALGTLWMRPFESYLIKHRPHSKTFFVVPSKLLSPNL